MRTLIPTLLLAFTLTACSKESKPLYNVPDIPGLRANLAFTCAQEADRLPPLDPEADELFRYGRYLQLRPGPKEFDDVARYYRIAAAHGHYKANTNLQLLISQGFAWSPFRVRESIDLASQLIDAGVPSGYYDIGFYLNRGFGLKQNREMALRYFRKAADLGNPAAQFYVAEHLRPMDKAPDIAIQMFQCAADQGHGKAADTLGIIFDGREQYAAALPPYQKAVQAGLYASAHMLAQAFDNPSTDSLYYLALTPDPERVRRYKEIDKFLNRWEYHNPKIPDLDQIVPLPPAPLPEWDGTFQWKRERDAAGPPPQPSDALIRRLAQAKKLDPATGLPLDLMPEPKATLKTLPPLGTLVNSGEPCPQNGVWCVPNGLGLDPDFRKQHFTEGTTMPRLIYVNPRRYMWLDRWLGYRYVSAAMTWELVAYRDRPA
ncbi:SEL1-like repeat protein [Cupriavidus agavae]|uniref:DUF6396 domain-containing protein n=1 Tax=Cupriavidus agavae TaxID=1001822 RepID=A0A4Q7RXQ7_9BURK|nr:sel1 repeat family protein [Cupriavidus agavae]RZT38686.1 hypothetical protein EV147_3159 [Cupriavidus agavae]